MVTTLIIEKNTHLHTTYTTMLLKAFKKRIHIDIVENSTLAIEKIKTNKHYSVIIIDIEEKQIKEAIETAKKIRQLGFKKAIIAHTNLSLEKVAPYIDGKLFNGFRKKSNHYQNIVQLLKTYQIKKKKKRPSKTKKKHPTKPKKNLPKTPKEQVV